MSEPAEFFDIHDQTKYQIIISRPKNPEDLSDLFVTRAELMDLCGENHYIGYNKDAKQTITLRNVVTKNTMEWGEKLIASGKKTLRIDDEDLLVVLKQGHLSDYTEGAESFGRHGDRICFSRQFKRKKTKPTQGDVNDLWSCMFYAFRDKFNVYPSHVPRYDRGISMFKAFKSIVGWRRTVKHCRSDHKKFYRQIWDNPEEHIK